MKNVTKFKSATRRFNLKAIGLPFLMSLVATTIALGDPLYFDTNGATAGSGVTAAAVYTNWTSQPYWSTSSAGIVTTTSWVPGSDAYFAAGDPAESYTVALATGPLSVGSITKAGAGTVTLSIGAGTPALTSTGTFDVISGGLTVNVVLTGSSGLTKNGAGTLGFGGSAATYTGDTTINAGTLRMFPARIPVASRLILNNSAIFQNYSGNNTVAGISSASTTSAIENGANATTSILTIKKASGDESFAGIIRNGTGIAALTKDGAYVQRLSGSNTYTGATTITAGTLLINGNGSLATGNVSVASGATLGGTGTVGGATTLAAGGLLSPGDGSLAKLTFSSSLDISAVNNAGNLKFSLATVAASDLIASGALSIGTGVLGFNDFAFATNLGFGGGTYMLFDATSITGSLDAANLVGTIGGLASTLSISGNDILLTVVPEPSSALLVGFGMFSMVLMVRRARARLKPSC